MFWFSLSIKKSHLIPVEYTHQYIFKNLYDFVLFSKIQIFGASSLSVRPPAPRSPPQTAPPPASPWRSAVAVGTRRRRCPSWWVSPRWGRGRRTCCCRWRPAAARCPSRRSAVRCYGNTGAACTGWRQARRSLLRTLMEREGRGVGLFSFCCASFLCDSLLRIINITLFQKTFLQHCMNLV